MGVLISRAEEPKVYKQVLEEAMQIRRISEEIQVIVASKPSTKHTQTAAAKEGFCIRCGGDIALDTKKPYCLTCFRSWKRYEKLLIHREVLPCLWQKTQQVNDV